MLAFETVLIMGRHFLLRIQLHGGAPSELSGSGSRDWRRMTRFHALRLGLNEQRRISIRSWNKEHVDSEQR